MVLVQLSPSENEKSAQRERLDWIISTLMELPAQIEAAQAVADDLEIEWAVRKAKLSAAVLENNSWPVKNPSRKASNQEEREIAINHKLNRSTNMRVLRRELKKSRRQVAMLRSQQENFRVILTRLPG